MIQQLKKVIREAPEGATHYADGTYFKKKASFPDDNWFEFTGLMTSFELSLAKNIPSVSKLSDLKKIVEIYDIYSDTTEKLVNILD